jgi:hypothetical protein
MTIGQWQRSFCCHTKPPKGAGSFGLAPNRLRGVIGVNEFQMHLKLLAEQRRLQDLERRYREAEKVALRELLFASSDDDTETDDDLEVSDDGENEATDQ